MSSQACTGARVAAYIAYHVPPVALVTGCVRTAIAVVCLVQLYFFEQAFDKHVEAQKLDGAVTAVDQAVCTVQDFVQRGVNALGKLLDTDLGNTKILETVQGIKNKIEARKKTLQHEFWRGVTEIFLIGAPIYTYLDNRKKERVSIFGLKELEKAMDLTDITDDIQRLVTQFS